MSSAVITLLSSLFVAVFLVGPALTAHLLIEWLIIKQPSRSQSSTEELGRALFGSIPALVLALCLFWLFFHSSLQGSPQALLRALTDNTFNTWVSLLPKMWPLRTIFYLTYGEVVCYVVLVWVCVLSIPRLKTTNPLYKVFSVLTSPYLKSEWDVLATGLLLPPGTMVYADVATRSQKIYMGQLAGVKTSSDGSLIHLQLSNPIIRGQSIPSPGGGAVLIPPYFFLNSSYFVIPAGEIANINLRFQGPVPAPAAAPVAPPPAPVPPAGPPPPRPAPPSP